MELPHRLIESFKATLEEVGQADLLLHVVDISHPNYLNLYHAVNVVLEELNALDKPTIIVLNKMDRLTEKKSLDVFKLNFKDPICISGLTGENIAELIDRITDLLSEEIISMDVDIPLDRMDLVNLAHREGQVHQIEYKPESVHIKVSLPVKIAAQFARFY